VEYFIVYFIFNFIFHTYVNWQVFEKDIPNQNLNISRVFGVAECLSDSLNLLESHFTLTNLSERGPRQDDEIKKLKR